MSIEGATRLLALACVLGSLAILPWADVPPPACRTDRGACAQEGLAPCGLGLGPWQVARSRGSGLPASRSNSACVLRARGGVGPSVALVPQAEGTSGDTLLSRRQAQHIDRQRASLRLTSRAAVPDHWVFALAGSFLDDGDRTACIGLHVRPPVNAGYALIGGNWAARPHGFYFERLADACVFDGTRSDCGGDAAFIAHEFTPDESFALDLALRREADRWWLEATVGLDDAGGRRELGHMRRAVPAPCWLAADDPGRALVLVIPAADAARQAPDARVEVVDFAWRE
jgi:hypothetical protein